MKQGILRFGQSLFLLGALGGCAALSSAKGGADAAKGAADEAKGQKDSATAAVKDEKDKDYASLDFFTMAITAFPDSDPSRWMNQ